METLNRRELEDLVEELLDILWQELPLHRELAELLQEKEEALVNLQLERLDEIMGRERGLIEKIGRLEEERVRLTETIGILIDHPDPGSLRLSAILPYVSVELADSLLDVREELRNVADRIEKVQERNRTLIQHSLDHIHLFLSVLSGVDSTLKDYSPHCSGLGTVNPAVLDRRF